MLTVKRFLKTMLGGGLFGAALFAWFSPMFIKWYGTPPVAVGLNCEPMIGWTIDAYRWAILAGLAVGAVVGALGYVAFIGRAKPTQPPIAAELPR